MSVPSQNFSLNHNFFKRSCRQEATRDLGDHHLTFLAFFTWKYMEPGQFSFHHLLKKLNRQKTCLFKIYSWKIVRHFSHFLFLRSSQSHGSSPPPVSSVGKTCFVRILPIFYDTPHSADKSGGFRRNFIKPFRQKWNSLHYVTWVFFVKW